MLPSCDGQSLQAVETTIFCQWARDLESDEQDCGVWWGEGPSEVEHWVEESLPDIIRSVARWP
jgi:hypothetical protein